MPGWREDELPLHDKLDRDTARARLSVQRDRAPRAGAQLGRPVHHALGRGREDPRRPQLDSITVASGLLHDVVEDTDVTLADVEAEFGKEIADDRRRPDEDRQAADGRLVAGTAGRELPQAAAVDREGRARHHRQARRPPAQHADARLAAAGEARAHRAGDARPLRAARAPLRYGASCGGSSRISRSSISRPTSTKRSRRRSRRSAASAKR